MEPIKKLFRVNLRGLKSSVFGSSYVIAQDSNEAYQKVRKHLDEKNYGFSKERELESVELIAENIDYTDTQKRLFL